MLLTVKDSTTSGLNIAFILERRLKEFNHLLEEFTEAWNCVRETLETYSE